MTVPIIIINWNGYTDTMECMNSVLQSEYQDFRIYLLDNGSANDEGIRLQNDWALESRVEVRILKENLGFTKANNLILKEIMPSPRKVVILLNNDTVVDKRWLRALLDTYAETGAGMIASKFLNYYKRELVDNLGHHMLNTGEVIPIGHGQPAAKYTVPFETFGACAGAALYSMDMLRDIDVFDDHFTTGYEDAELGVRAILCGYQSLYEPRAIVFHKMGQSIKKIFDRDYALMIQKSIWYTYFKLMPSGVILISLPSILFKIVSLTVMNLIFFRFDFLGIQWRALLHTVRTFHRDIRRKRQAFFLEHQTISSWQILKKQRFFLWFDLGRFYHIFIRGKKSAIDTYGGK